MRQACYGQTLRQVALNTLSDLVFTTSLCGADGFSHFKVEETEAHGGC